MKVRPRLKPEAAAALLDIAPAVIREACRNGGLPAINVKSAKAKVDAWRIREDDLDMWDAAGRPVSP